MQSQYKNKLASNWDSKTTMNHGLAEDWRATKATISSYLLEA